MIMTQVASLERLKVLQAMFAILGQDYKGGGNLLRDRIGETLRGESGFANVLGSKIKILNSSENAN